MKRAVAAVVLALALAGAQSALLRQLGGGLLPLALPLSVVVWLGLDARLVEGAAAAAAVGFVVDVLAGGPAGLLVSLAVVLFLGARLARGALALQGAPGFAILCGAGTFATGFAALLLTRATAGPEAAPSWHLLARVLLEAVATGAVSAFLHPLLALLGRRLEPEPERLPFR